MSAPHVSVIIPTFNRSALLERALRSVAAQTLPPLEIIVVDDGSTDDTAQRLRDAFPEVRYIERPHRGVSAARNAGLETARGEWLAFLDSDDEWAPRKLQRQWAALQAQPEYRLCHTDEIWIRDGRRVNPMKKHAKRGGWVFEDCLSLCAISPSSVLLHRGLIDEVGAFDESLPACEDYDLWLRICARNPVLYVDEPLVVKYGGHADQLSRAHWGMDRFRLYALDKLLCSGVLSHAQAAAARATLDSKAKIFLNGARKRDRTHAAVWVQTLVARHLGQAARTRACVSPAPVTVREVGV